MKNNWSTIKVQGNICLLKGIIQAISLELEVWLYFAEFQIHQLLKLGFV